MERIQGKLGLGCWQVRFVSCCMKIAKLVVGLGAQSQPDSKSPHLYLETVFPAHKLTQNRYLHYNVKIFLENR